MENRPDSVKPLDRYLSQIDVWAMAFGCMCGWGIFAMPGNTFLPLAGPAGTLIAVIIGMGIMLIIGNNFSFLMGRSTITGGVYSYTKDAFGRDHAFLSSWFLCLSYLTVVFLNGTAMFYVVRILFGDAQEYSFHYTIAGNRVYLAEILISAAVLAVAGLLSAAAKPMIQHVFTVLSIVLFAGTVIISASCLPGALAGGAYRSFGITGVNRYYAVFSLIILMPWAFVGFEVTSFDTAHFRFPIKKTRKLIFLSIISAAFSYIAMALVSVASFPEGFSSWQEYILGLGDLRGTASVPTFYVAGHSMGTAGLVIMTATASAAILTGIIGGYRATTRILTTMAEDRILSDFFSSTTCSILFIMVISILLSLLGRNTLNWFVDVTTFGAIIGFGYTSAAAWKFAKAEDNRMVVITGAVGTVISLVFVVVQLVPRLTALEAMGSEGYLLLAFWCLIGFAFYWRTIRKSALGVHSGLSTSGIVLFSLLIYSSMMWLAKLLMQEDSVEGIRALLPRGGMIVFLLVFTGLIIMLYVQSLLQKKHEESERDKIRAMESSLAKSRFLFNMSHDIRTPMNAIIGYTNLALQEPSSPEVHDYLEKISSSNQQLLALINDILEMSRIESGKVELELSPVDLTALFDEIRDLFSEQMRQKELHFNVHTSQLRNRYVWCDRKNLNRVLLNVLSNAYKFTPSGGTVSASIWETGEGVDGYGSYEIRVQDNGIGMSKEFAEKMFHAFERERTSTVSGTEGTGLGLAITKSLVDLMGGSIEVLTAPGSGTTMIIRLKAKLASEEEIPDREKAPAPEKDFSGRKILLVEDNYVNMEIARMILTNAGFTVDTAENGRAAVEKVAASAPEGYDVILMDIQMPEMNGYEAARAIRAMEDKGLASIPILAMTANAFKEDEQDALDAGMQAHIAKPIDIEDMLKKIADFLR